MASLAEVRPSEQQRTAVRFMPLLRELGDLKRIHSAGRDGSIASRLFLKSWSALIAGAEPAEVMRQTVGAALAAARLADLDAEKLRELGLGGEDARAILVQAFDAVSAEIDGQLAAELRVALGTTWTEGASPPFALLLVDQPRAGVTCPGKPRIVLQPAESHAEHCLTVAVYGVLLAPTYGADPVAVFLAGLGHHFHNAAMPDSGFTGETLLGAHLDGILARARAAALDQLPGTLRDSITAALAHIDDDRTPEGRAFNAADVIDRVLEVEQHMAAAQLTMAVVLRDYELVHAGPVKAFHDAVLREVALL